MFLSCRLLAWRSFCRPIIQSGLADVQFNALRARVVPEGAIRGRALLRSALPTIFAAVASTVWLLSPTIATAAAVEWHATAAHSVRVDEEASPRALGTVNLSQLPAQAQATDRLIHEGGPFPFPKDGVVFGNRERALPRQARGFYHEYTVPTPGAHNRGARRIVCGGNPPSRPEACYYTDDHYQTFRRITP